jgi:2',3'-cyclic-nucleotide 2'-phosphodiesterase (5'-nucleotidase family)
MHFALRILIIVGFNCLISCKPAYFAFQQSPALITVHAATPASNPIETFLKPYRDSVSVLMDVPMAMAEGPLVKERPAGSLGNFFCDALLAVAQERDARVQLAITNYGGLRVNRWAQGAILIRNVYELMPFDNALVVLDVPGAVLQQWMAHMAKMGGWPIAGVCVRADTLRNTYQLSNCTAGVPLGIEMQKTYRVATSDYIANGGDRCDFLIGLKQQNTGLLLRDALLQYLKQTKNIQPNSQNRFTFQTKP